MPNKRLAQIQGELKKAVESGAGPWAKDHYTLDFVRLHNDAFSTAVDHPAVQPITVASLAGVMLQALAACRPGREGEQFSYALIPRFRAQRAHPIALSPALARAVVADRAAESLSDAIRRNARMVGYLDVHDRGVVVNRNTPA